MRKRWLDLLLYGASSAFQSLWHTFRIFPDPGNSVVVFVIVIAVTIISLVVGFVLFNKGRSKLP